MSIVTKNLGQVAGIVFSLTPPTNKKILWYDETVTADCPIKFFNLTTNNWESLK